MSHRNALSGGAFIVGWFPALFVGMYIGDSGRFGLLIFAVVAGVVISVIWAES